MANINWSTVGLLCISNFFMSCAWYWPMKRLAGLPLWSIILISWLIAGLEYCFVIPANTIGSRTMSLQQLKITQEAVSLTVFIPFSMMIMHQSVSWNYLAAFACILGALVFIFWE